ncbi:unnamed protein product (macronuclear) [Paramecium tetraurelia]|uniref:Uncharacterized protein n=1 Tax=Paramecium tetraurelia TaxID=5888 RepID=A0D724_PARTE|nr:uncharacterized protein GSPATT00001882001 [Paramecium tetraurelia]CAK78841.1 unnamed protein product [Paramecium tetraurelia]|eukprot:XP_001446238.1 hypothetical protein (macronuclear) [Paramecium tetraurelia strain d4-2]
MKQQNRKPYSKNNQLIMQIRDLDPWFKLKSQGTTVIQEKDHTYHKKWKSGNKSVSKSIMNITNVKKSQLRIGIPQKEQLKKVINKYIPGSHLDLKKQSLQQQGEQLDPNPKQEELDNKQE